MTIASPDRRSQQAIRQKVDAQFQRDSDGRMVFYVDKNHRVGYVVDPPEREIGLRDYTLRRNRLGQVLAPFASVVVPLFAYVVAPRYPWWLVLLYCFAALAVFILPGWLWQRKVTAGLAKIGGTFPPSPKLCAVLAIVAAALVFICLYQPSPDPTLPAGSTAFYTDIGDPILLMLFGALLVYFIDSRSVQLIEKVGGTRYSLCLVIFSLFAIAGLIWSVNTFSSPTPRILLTTKSLSCDKDRIDWQAVSSIALTSGSRWHEYAKLSIDPAHRNDRGLSPTAYRRGYVSCEIDGTGAGYLAVYDAIEAAWKNRSL